MDFEKDLICKEVEKSFEKIKKLVRQFRNPQEKDSEKSTRIRKQGNQLFAQKIHSAKVHEKIWKLYCQSIASALNNSEELAAGYANRSALLLHLQKYRDCLTDIDRALKITFSDLLKAKLFCRQAECFTALRDENKTKSLAKAKFWLNKIDNDKSKKVVAEKIEKVEGSWKTNIRKVKTSERILDIKVPENSVYVTYDSKMGRGLSAAQDFKVGDFICQEKFFAVSCNNKKLYAYCSHCLGISWTAVPCDTCSYYMFCGEKCKEEAWRKYHDIECSLHLTVHTYMDYYKQISLRLLIQGVKEAGNIKNLRDMIEEVNNCTDVKTKGFSENGMFLSDSFKSVYSLCSAKSVIHMESFIWSALYALIDLAENSNIFGSPINCSNARNITGNNDLLFIGTLLLRLNLILSLNSFNAISGSATCKKDYDVLFCAYDMCCQKGMSFSPFLSLINHSCDANVSKLYTNDGSVVYYALKPIQKGDQLFSYYYFPFHRSKKNSRNKFFQQLFEFKCECKACKYNFPVLNDESFLHAHDKLGIDALKMHFDILKNYGDTVDTSGTKCKYRKCSEKTIKNYSKDVNIFLKKFIGVKPNNYPSLCIQVLTDMLELMIDGTYGTRLHIPKVCR